MKSILQGPKEEKKQEQEYPCLKISTTTGRVILFSAPQTGVVVHMAPPNQGSMGVGAYHDGWSENDFEPLKGKIILSN